MTGFCNKQYLPHALHKIMCEFYSLAQGKHRSNQEYYDKFNSLVRTAIESGTTIGMHPGGIKELIATNATNPLNPTELEHTTATKEATDRYLAIAFLLGADQNCYGTLVKEIENEFLRNKGPTSTAGTYPTNKNYNSGVAFIQDGSKPNDNIVNQEQVFTTNATNWPGTGGRYKKTRCQCGADGHNSIDCNSNQEKVEIFRQLQQPNQGVSQLIHAVNWDDSAHETANADEATNLVFLSNTKFSSKGTCDCTKYNKDGKVAKLHKTTVFSQSNSGIPVTWYLLNNQSTCDIVTNPKLVTNIRQVDGYMQLATQAGTTTTNWMADVPGYYCPVWFHPGSIANILSLVNTKAKYRVSYDSHHGNSPNQFCVHKENGKQRKFKQELYYLNTTATAKHTVLAITTVESNKTRYLDRDYDRAKLARKIQVLIGRPKLKDFLCCIDGKLLPNCPINRQDAINSNAIFGRDLGAINGKATCCQLKGILASVANNIPKTIMQQYGDITLCIDIMFVNCILFFVSMSRHLRFITAEVIDNRKETTLVTALKQIHGVYCKHCFWITTIHGNSEFECTRDAIATNLQSELNICGKDKHVPEIERCVRTMLFYSNIFHLA